jgi:hypothetical protein
MQLKRTLLWSVASGAVVVWIAAGATSETHPVATPPPPAHHASAPPRVPLAADVARLHERLRPTIAPLQSRDLFRYASRAPKASRVASVPLPSAAEVRPSPVALPPLSLVGIAEDTGDAGPVRTAIVSGFGDLFLVKAGESITARYRVVSVSPDVVELLDTTDQTTRRLPLP